MLGGLRDVIPLAGWSALCYLQVWYALDCLSSSRVCVYECMYVYVCMFVCMYIMFVRARVRAALFTYETGEGYIKYVRKCCKLNRY